jgi:XRE family aerobic/anaerobic benzoate catabolism transcriptional regulator
VDTQYTSSDAKRSKLLRGLGGAVRARRTERGLTLKALAKIAHVSERFLVQLETGEGNISVVRLADVAEALGTTAAELLASGAERPAPIEGTVALLGLRGAGKTAIGERLARSLGVPFVELDALVARRAGMSLEAVFEMHGERYFRRIEREVLAELLSEKRAVVLATSGSIVTDPQTYALLRQKTRTVWLRARALDHWERVVAQGDARPMRDRANAKAELKALLVRRTPLYEQADVTIDTSSLSLDEATQRVLRNLHSRVKK